MEKFLINLVVVAESGGFSRVGDEVDPIKTRLKKIIQKSFKNININKFNFSRSICCLYQPAALLLAEHVLFYRH